MIENGKIVSIEYVVKDSASGEVLDRSVDGEALEFLFGASQVIAGLENAINGKSKGDELNVVVSPEDGYGEYRVDFLQEVPMEQFDGIELKEGMTLFGHGENGQSVQVIVKSFNDKIVMIDYNHPLAGKTLEFDVKVLDVREPTGEEMNGCCGGAHHNEDGSGCCGAHKGGGGCGCSH